MSITSKKGTSSNSETPAAAKPQRRATILDVARAANVAPSTVSLVTNGTGYVSEEKRRVIEEVVRKVGYRPRGRQKAAARPARTPRPAKPATPTPQATPMATEQALDVVVLYVPVHGRAGAITETVLSVLEGANAAFAEQQIRPNMIAAANHIGNDAILLSHLRSRQIDGAILMGVGESADHGCIQCLREMGVPMVHVGRQAINEGSSSVNADFFRGSVLAAEHLQSLGHQRIGFVGLSADHWPTAERFRGYRQAQQKQGLPIDEPFYMQDLEPSRQRDATSAYLRAAVERGCTGFLMGDFHAKSAVPILESFGHDVPGDVSVVGFDHLEQKVGQRALNLTSIAYDKHFLGVTVVQTLLEIIKSGGRLAAANKTVSVSLYQGATTAPAASSS